MCKKINLLLVVFFLFFSVLLFAEVSTTENVASEDTAILDLDNIVKGLDEIIKGLETRAPVNEWLFMVYMAADNNLETAAINDFLEMATVGSDANINIVVQMDRISRYDSRYGNWTDTRRGIVNSSDEPDEYWGGSIGEVDMGDSQTLVDFVDWATTNYDAPNIALILWNHGGGWRSRIEELRSQLETRGEELSLYERDNILNEISRLEQKLREEEVVSKAVCWDDTSVSVLYTKEVGEALEYLYAGGEGINLHLIGFDACLMGMLEVAHEIKVYGDVMVASEKTEPLNGWPYNTILSDLADTPTMIPSELGSTIVIKYGESYEGEETQSAIDLTKIGALSTAVSDFADTVITQDTDWDVIHDAKQQAGYYSHPYYRDLKGFMQGVADNAANGSIETAALAVVAAFEACIVAYHSPNLNRDHGLSIYFADWGWDLDEDYNETNISFAQTSWDEFLEAYIGFSLTPEQPESYIYSRTVPASTYVMVSSPVTPSNLDPAANLQDDLGPYDKAVWRLFRWIPTFRGYREYPCSGWHEIYPGRGYWLISRYAATIDITGSLAETSESYFILLYPGWNQIGTPFNFDIDWDMVFVIGEYDYTYVTSLSNVLTYRTLWKYENGSYSASAIMEPGEGYWVKNLTGGLVGLIITPEESALSRDYIDLLESALTGFARAREQSPPSPPAGTSNGVTESSDDSGGGSGCFIATACFGSPMAEEVDILRNFRDRYLDSNPIGQVFVSLYYKYSPPIARFIGKHRFLKTIMRSSLYPIIKGCGALSEAPHRTKSISVWDWCVGKLAGDK